MKKLGNSDLICKIENEFIDNDEICVIDESTQSEIEILNGTSEEIEKFNKSIKDIFQFVRNSVKPMMVRKRGTIVFLLSPLSYNVPEHSYTPMYNLGIESFSKSLAKELNPFNVKVICIILPLSSQTKKIKDYDLVALKYHGISLVDQAKYIKVIIDNSEIFNGQTISLGSNLSSLK